MDKAELYSEQAKHFTKDEDIAKLLKEHEPLLSWGPDEVVLDAGCGPGDVTADVLLPWLPPDCQAVLGVDISPAMVQHALSKHGGGKLSFAITNVAEEVSDVLLLNEKFCNGFDKVFSFYLFNWIQDLKKGVNNIHYLLKTGGQALICFPTDQSFPRTFSAVCSKDPWRKYFKNSKRDFFEFPNGDDTAKVFKEILLSAGFEVTKCEVKDDILIISSIKVMLALIESLDPYFDRVPEKLKEQYLSECQKKMEDDGCISLEDGRVRLKQRLLLAVFKKL